MSKRLYFDDDATATLDSTLTILDGDSVSFDIRVAPGIAEFYLMESTDGTDAIIIDEDSGNIRLDSTDKSGVGFASLSDGDIHTLLVTRNGNNYEFSVDGVLGGTVTSAAATMTLNKIGGPCEISGMIINDYTYDMDGVDGNSWLDTTENEEITLSGQIEVCIDKWEWIGDFVHIDRSYQTQNGTVTEERKEGTRKRTVVGYAMENPINKQNGTESTVGIEAYNGGQISTLGLVTSTVDCDVENFTPITGTNFFTQTQTWVSYSITYPT